jgi:hypothetical protein
MTTMNTNTSSLHLPDPNNPKSLEAHKFSVLSEFGPIFNVIELALRDSVPKATDVFSLFGGPVDPSVHAGFTRYLCKQFLTSRHFPAEFEDPSDFEVDQVANCGLCLNRSQSQIRILKSSSGGIPKATSEARRRFYSSNQYLLPFNGGDRGGIQPQIPLSLVVLWTLADKFSFKEMEIACPRMELADGSVDCYWIAPWRFAEGSLGVNQVDSLAPDSDLEEIRPIEERKKARS